MAPSLFVTFGRAKMLWDYFQLMNYKTSSKIFQLFLKYELNLFVIIILESAKKSFKKKVFTTMGQCILHYGNNVMQMLLNTMNGLGSLIG